MSWATFDNTAVTQDQGRAYGAALEALHAFHDAFVAAAPGAELLDQLAADLSGWADVLTPMAMPEPDRLTGRIPSLPVRGVASLPPIVTEVATTERRESTVTFGQYFLGAGNAAHGGMIMAVFDEVLGMMSVAGAGKPARTAYLKTDFRATVPLDVPIRVTAWMERREGRKRYVRGEMWAGDVLCAEAESLFIELRDDAH